MSKLNQWLTLVANLSVVVGIVFLAAEMRQNTEAVQAQTRDSITEKQMEFYGWLATNRDLAEIYSGAIVTDARIADLTPADRTMLNSFWQGVLREWENSYYQYAHGLFEEGEYEARIQRWRSGLSLPSVRDIWTRSRDTFAPGFRADVDRIVAEVEPAQ